MKAYLPWASGAALLLIFLFLFAAWRTARRSLSAERSRRRQLEKIVKERFAEHGLPRILDLLEAYYQHETPEFPYPYGYPMHYANRDLIRLHDAEEMILTRRHLRSVSRSESSMMKRELISKLGPKSFYYLDETQVRDLYPQVFREPEPKEIETQQRASASRGIKAKLKVLEPALENQNEDTTRKRFEIELTPVIMFNRVEEYFFSKADVTFGLEEFQHDTESIQMFRSMCRLMDEKFHFPVPTDLQNKYISDQLRSLALNAVTALSSTSGYVVFQAEFSVSGSANAACTLSLEHPLNQHLLPSDPRVVIEICCNSVSLTPAGKATFTNGNSVKITCLGKVVRWDSGRAALVVNPIAVY